MTTTDIEQLESLANLGYSSLKTYLDRPDITDRDKSRVTGIDHGLINKIRNGKRPINSVRLDTLMTALMGIERET